MVQLHNFCKREKGILQSNLLINSKLNCRQRERMQAVYTNLVGSYSIKYMVLKEHKSQAWHGILECGLTIGLMGKFALAQ